MWVYVQAHDVWEAIEPKDPKSTIEETEAWPWEKQGEESNMQQENLIVMGEQTPDEDEVIQNDNDGFDSPEMSTQQSIRQVKMRTQMGT